MKKILTRSLGAAIAALLCATPGYAKQGAPHTFVADAYLQTVSLQWRAPQDEKNIQWHNDYSYNGDDFTQSDLQKAQVCYAGAKFTADDLKEFVGEVVDGITYNQYRDLLKVTALVYENGTVVSQGVADRSKYVKNENQKIMLDKPVTIKENTEYIFAIKVEGGSNMNFVVMKDKETNAPGKGDLYSTDGKNWVATGAGDYLITANIATGVDEAPTGYKVYVDGAPQDVEITSKKNDYSGVNENFATLTEVPAGAHEIYIEASYGDALYASPVRRVQTIDLAHLGSTAHFSLYSKEVFKANLTWSAPLSGGNELTWGSKTVASSIGGSAASNTKVWFRNVFGEDDLAAFGANAQITEIKTIFTEAVITSGKIYVIKDNVIDYVQDLTEDQIKAIKANEMQTFALTTPYALTPGHTYAYGMYVMHTAKAHPIAITDAATVDGLGNTFSVTSPSSKGFEQTKPTWKTLKSGSIYGNWALYATLTGATSIPAPTGYTLARDGKVLATGLTDKAYTDEVTEPGRYVYTLTAEYADRKAYSEDLAISFALPSEYAAPDLSASYNTETATTELSWTTDKLLAKYDDIAYLASFDEELTMMWGAQFTADELKPYAGMKINRLKFIMGEDIGAFKVGVYGPKGKVLSEVSFEAGEVTPQSLYVLNLPTPAEITGEEDIYLAYSGTVPAKTGAMVIDEGPLKTGGARISLTNGMSWMNLATMSATYNDYNLVIGAYVTEDEGATTTELTVPVQAQSLRPAAVEATAEPIEALNNNAPVAKAPALPKVAKYNVYRNGELIASTTEKAYNDKLTSFNVYNYAVTAVYENGWESPESKAVTISRPIAQRSVAPYALQGAKDDAGNLNLTWQAPDKALALTYVQGTKVGGLGLTGSNLTPHVFIKFTADDLKPYIGQRIDHILFALYTNQSVTDVAIEIAEDENIVYHQPVNSIDAGWNDVRLNEPYLIKGGTDLYIGYTLAHPSGVKPLGVDCLADNTFPCDKGKGDILTNSATPGYWYVLSTKYKLNYNWAIKAVLANDDQKLKTEDYSTVAYNVYCDDAKIAELVTTTSYTVPNAQKGVYYVTAVDEIGSESGESNRVYFNVDGINDITVDGDTAAEYFNLQGIRVDADNITPGVYIRRTADGKATKVIVK